MTREDNITRSTFYIPRYLHNKAKEAGINISKEIKSYLETILFGDNVGDVKYQLDQLIDKKKQLQIDLTTVNNRIDELEKVMSEHDSRMNVEKKLYKRFLNHCRGHIQNSSDNNVPLNTKRLLSYWKQDYFSDNGMKEDIVLDVLDQVRHDCFDFEFFQQLRRGDIPG